MLENRGVLLTWELPKLPPGPLPATFEQLGIRRLPDHRIDYLEYEGPVSNGRGTVQRVDFGEYQLTSGEWGEFIQVVACGRCYLLEFLVPKAIFSRIDGLGLEIGEVVSFIEIEHANSDD